MSGTTKRWDQEPAAALPLSTTDKLLVSQGGLTKNCTALDIWTGLSAQLSGTFDDAFGSTQGMVVFRSDTGWHALPPSNSGFFLQTRGLNNNPLWAQQSWRAGVVTRIDTGSLILNAGTLSAVGNDLWQAGTVASIGPNLSLISGVLDATGTFDTAVGGDLSGTTAAAVVVSLNGGETIAQSATIDTTNASNITSGTLALSVLPAIASGDIIGNPTGGSLAPAGVSISSILDQAIDNVRGDLLFRGATGWDALPHGTAGQVLATGGAGADPSWTDTGASGTVSSVDTGAGLTGGPITTAGTVSLHTVGTNRILANITGTTDVPIANSLSDILDAVVDNAQGDLLFRGVTNWTKLLPGTAGEVLTTGGAAANPSWQAAGAGGTVTSVATGAGLTGGPISTTGTLAFAQITSHTVLANVTGGAAVPSPTTVTALLDIIGSPVQGDILYRGGSGWTFLPPGTAGQQLQSGGSGAAPSWTNAGAGSVTSITAGTGLSGGVITGAGTIALAADTITSLTGAQTLDATHDRQLIKTTDTTSVTYTLNSAAAGTKCIVVQGAAGQVTFVSGTATLRNRQGDSSTAGQWAEVSLLWTATGNCVLAGDTV